MLMPITRINIGPIHPSTHGVLRLVVDLDGDTIMNVEPHIGFLHRGVEKLVENRLYMQSHVYMEKMDYAAPLSEDELFVSTVEAAMGIEVKERAQYIRVVLLEMQRLASHLLWLGTMCNDIGQLFTVFMWAFADRDMVIRLLEAATGSRMFHVNMRLGGVIRDLPPDFDRHTLELMDYLEKRIKEYEDFLEKNPIFMERTKGIGTVSRAEAVNLGLSGPVLRASGVSYDVRSSYPYYVYEKLNFSPHYRNEGDCFARYKVRMLEMTESIKIVRMALGRMPEGDAAGMPVKLVMPPIKNREVHVRREMPRGENAMYMIADNQRPYRLSIRSSPFINLAALKYMSKGHKLADLFAILGSLDLVIADIDK
jgi:NADH-quinone oxidoreductase subunit D